MRPRGFGDAERAADPPKALAGPPQIDGVLDALKGQGDDGAQKDSAVWYRGDSRAV